MDILVCLNDVCYNHQLHHFRIIHRSILRYQRQQFINALLCIFVFLSCYFHKCHIIYYSFPSNELPFRHFWIATTFGNVVFKLLHLHPTVLFELAQ